MALLEQVDAVFLPGALLPAAVRYAPLLAALGDIPGLLPEDLELSADGGPPDGYGVETEVLGLDRFADERGLDRFHLYGPLRRSLRGADLRGRARRAPAEPGARRAGQRLQRRRPGPAAAAFPTRLPTRRCRSGRAPS